MQLTQRKLYRFWQQLRGVKQTVSLTDHALAVQFNQDTGYIGIHQIRQLDVKKGWWFAQLQIINEKNETLILKGYLARELETFKMALINKLVERYSDERIWQRFLDCIVKIEYKQTFFSSYEWQPWVDLNALAVQFSKLGIEPEDINLPLASLVFRRAALLKIQGSSQAHREQVNQQAVAVLLKQHSGFFDSVEKMPLTDKQRLACVTNDDHNLIIAGAGSGKTATLVGKAGYLIASHLASPSQILLLAFGQKAAKEMNERIEQRLPNLNKQPKASTFHALGFEIVSNCAANNPNMQRLVLSEFSTDSAKLNEFIQTVLIEKSLANQTLFAILLDYLKLNNHAQFQPSELVVNRSFLSLVRLITRYIGLFKESGKSLEDIQNIEKSEPEKQFYKLFKPVYLAYQQALSDEGALDFSDMIAKACSHLNKGEYESPYRYILVDEYQDISPARAALVSALLKSQPNVRLFAVGDDWQAIYRFNGADLSLFTEFEQYFSPASRIQLDKTFRFNQKIHLPSSEFVCANLNQIRKTITTHTRVEQDCIHFIEVDGEASQQTQQNGYMNAIMTQLNQLNLQAKNLNQPIRILLIGRQSLNKMPMLKALNLAQFNFEQLQVQYVTAHASKGLEADIVFIIGMEKGLFPSEQTEASVLNHVLAQPEGFLYAEERRLFHVALTRAKHQVYLFYSKNNASPFIPELASLVEKTKPNRQKDN